MYHFRKQWIFVAVLVALSGCAGMNTYREGVRVTVSDIEILESTMMEQLYRVTLRIQNRNDQPLSVQGGSFDLEINGKDFGSGVTDAAVMIPPYSDAKLEVRMVSTLFGMLRIIRSLQDRDAGEFDYSISGRLAVEGVLGGLSFLESGELSLPRSPNEAGDADS